MNSALTAKQIADILLEHPDAYGFKLGGVLDRYKIVWNNVQLDGHDVYEEGEY